MIKLNLLDFTAEISDFTAENKEKGTHRESIPKVGLRGGG